MDTLLLPAGPGRARFPSGSRNGHAVTEEAPTNRTVTQLGKATDADPATSAHSTYVSQMSPRQRGFQKLSAHVNTIPTGARVM